MSGQFLLPVGLLALVFAAGCAPTVRTGPTGTPSAPTQAPSALPTGPSAEIEIDVFDGPHAGSYRAVAESGCKNEPGRNEFSVTYADEAAPDGFVALHLVLRDAAAALEDESSDFLAEISLGGTGAGTSYTIDPVNGAGDGSVFLEASATDATLDLGADMPDGAQLELTVICDLS